MGCAGEPKTPYCASYFSDLPAEGKPGRPGGVRYVPGSAKAPQNCKMFFDGCNTCEIAANGDEVACTEMMCEYITGEPECSEWHTVR